MAAAASAAAQQHAAAAELVEKHEMNVLSTYTRASHVALAAVSAREELSDLHDTTALENLKRFARSREAAFMDVEDMCVERVRRRWCYLTQADCAVRGSQVDPNRTRSGPEVDPLAGRGGASEVDPK